MSVSTKAEALKEREAGNAFFRAGDYYKAIEHYNNSIDIDQSMTASFLNRALMYLRTECPGAAISDIDKALLLLAAEDADEEGVKKSFAKAYYRKGYAHYVLGHMTDALKLFQSALKFVPTDRDSTKMCKECKKEETKRKFLLAITSEESKRPYEVIDWQNFRISENEKESIRSLWSASQDESAENMDASCFWESTSKGSITKEFIFNMLETFKKGKLLHQRYTTRIFMEARDTFAKFPNAVPINYTPNSRITVCGDVHGQFFDLMQLFDENGFPSEENPYLFNGDVVDRGAYSVECLLTMCAFKILLPNHFFLARGNHEGLNLNKVYGFENEMRTKYTSDLYDLAHDVFRSLPLCHVLGNTVFVVHGGLFQTDGVTLRDINKVNRAIDIPESGLMCDMLWSDPQDKPGRSENKRGIGVAFGPDVTKHFLETNGFALLVRSHEVKHEGYEVHHEGKCITVFSAPNYCGQVGNKAAYLRFTFDRNTGFQSTLANPEIRQFNAALSAPHAKSFMNFI